MQNVCKLLGLLAVLVFSHSVSAKESTPSKIHPMLRDGNVDFTQGFLVYLTEQADISQANHLKTKEKKGRLVYEKRREVARRAQAAIRAELDALEVQYHAYWIINAIWVRGDQSVMEELATREDISKILPNPSINNYLPKPKSDVEGAGESARGVAWGVQKTGAPVAWKMGITGEGSVIAGADTGYDWEHAAIKNMYRGFNGSSADHNYNWHDAVHDSGGECPADSEEPCDDSSHGTHTMGTMLGDDGNSNQIGMAPGAKWMGCRNMHNGEGTPARYIECYEFFVAPYPVGGDPIKDGDPALAPDVISNSWSCPPYEGCDVDTLLEIVDTVRAAGIVDVASAGNSGPECYTVDTPVAIYGSVFSVGATNQSDWITDFSSLGPVTVDGSDRLKPDVSAPGQSVYSCIPGGEYTTMSGTSMACPHVAGMVGLLISAEPKLAGDVALIEDIIKYSAIPLTSSTVCGKYKAGVHPNPIYGYGRIDVPEALEYMGFEIPDSDTDADTDTDTDSDTDTDTEEQDTDDDTGDTDTDTGDETEGGGDSGCGCSAAGKAHSSIFAILLSLLF